MLPSLLPGSLGRFILVVTGIAALVLSVSAIRTAHPAFTTSGFSSGRVVLLVELLGSTETDEDILEEWDNFAGAMVDDTEHADVRILCKTSSEEELASSMVHLSPFPVLGEETWAEVLRRIQEEEAAPTIVGLFAAGSLPVKGLRHSMIAALEAFDESPEEHVAVVSRSSVRGPAVGVVRGGTWLSDMLVAQLWCNPPALSHQFLIDAGLEGVTVQGVSMLGAISIILREAMEKAADGSFRLVDGTDLLRSTVHGKAPTLWCQQISDEQTPHYTCERPRAILGSKVDARPASEEGTYDGTREEEIYHVRNVGFSIGDLGVAVVATIEEDGFSPIKYSFDHASWPPNYLLETLCSRDGLVIVTSVNCGYLDMATNFLLSVQAHSDAKVLFVTTDEVAFQFMDEIAPGQASMFPAVGSERHQHATQAGTIGDGAFKDQVTIRPDILASVVAQGYGVLWTDNDVVWLADLMPFLPPVGNPSEADIMVQHDHGMNICTCFLFMKPASVVKNLIQRWKEEIVSGDFSDDQGPFQKPLKYFAVYKGLKVDFVPQYVMPSGRDYFMNRQRFDGQAKTIHNNWIKGHDKKNRRFMDHDMWYVYDVPFPTCGEERRWRD